MIKREADCGSFPGDQSNQSKRSEAIGPLAQTAGEGVSNEKGNAKIWRLPGRDVPFPNFGEFIARGVIMENLLTL